MEGDNKITVSDKLLIAHRGNLNGPNSDFENEPGYIDYALASGFQAEIDLWLQSDGNVYLGHDEPQYEISFSWLHDRAKKLWIHCKNAEALFSMCSKHRDLHYFWHEEDRYTITSLGWVWAYPNQVVPSINIYDEINSVCVMPEIKNSSTTGFSAICTDFVNKYD